MSQTYKQLWSELVGTFPRLSPFLAQRFIQRSYKDVRDTRLWSFLKSEGILYSPALISSGRFSITQFSNSVTADAAAITALSSLTNPIITKRQVRFGILGTVYSIAGVDASFASNGILTLDRVIRESTNATATYRCHRCYYGPPEDGTGVETTDFLRFNSVYNPAISDYFRDVHISADLLNKKDPQRSNVSNNPYYLADYKYDSSGNPMFEMWPHPTAAGAYICSYQRKGIDLADTEILPTIIPDGLVLEKAMWYGCMWAQKNATRYTELKGVNWTLMAQQHKKAFSNISSADPGLLEIAQRQDNEVFEQDMIVGDREFSRPVGDDDKTGFYSITA